MLFLEQGVVAAGKDVPVNFINCSYQELLELAEEFGVTVDQLPADVAQFCLQ